MYRLNDVFRLLVCIFIVASLAGCATTSNTAPGSGTDDGVYHPKLPEGITTFDDAIHDLTRVLENRKSPVRVHLPRDYYIQNNLKDYESPAGKLELQKGAAANGMYYYFQDSIRIDAHTVFVRDEMLEVSSRIFTLYTDLIQFPISVQNGSCPRIQFRNNLILEFSSEQWADARRVADDLFFIQQNLRKHQAEQLALLESKAAEYRALNIRPQVSEAQRRYIVQANAANQRKDYGAAIYLYLEAVELDPVSYPEAYFNMALLSAQLKRYQPAISYMKKYLVLAPDAKDARSAQDKIYEWEYLAPTIHETATKITTGPPDAFLEVNVSDSGKRWVYIGRAPGNASFWCTEPKVKYCLIRASKPGYHTEEKSFQFESLPAEVHIELRKSDSVQDNYGYLGISFQIVTDELAKSLKMDKPKGVVVVQVGENTPADEAGLKDSDIILTLAGTEIREQVDLPRVVASTPIGETVDVIILRNGRERTVRVKIGNQPK